MMNITNTLCGCKPYQIININLALNNLNNIKIYNDCDEEYDLNSLQYSYSVDSLCWSCYISYNDFLTNTLDLQTDFYVRIKVQGEIKSILLNNQAFYDYSTQLDSSFNFTYCDSSSSSNVYNPYNNMDCTISLYQNLSNTVSCIVGIPIYYFKLSPNIGSKDITFKEYALMDVSAVKQIKLIIPDGQMPSSKPEFADFGLEWQSDWETEIPKQMFATAFGPTAQPTEGDLIYIPMMKRMWMINEAYEEKKDAFMWVATTFKVTLVKYQEKGSVDLKDTESLVNSFVKNKYEDIFGNNDEDTRGSGEEFNSAPVSAQDNLLPIYESDAQRKYVSCEGIDIKDESTYYKGTVISDKMYFYTNMTLQKKIVYQQKFCGTNGTLSFIIKPQSIDIYNGTLITIGKLKIDIKQNAQNTELKVNKSPRRLKLILENTKTYFVFLRWSKDLKIVEFSSAEYTYPESIPIYKVQPGNYYYDIDNLKTTSDKWNIEYSISNKTDIILNGFLGSITNIKLFNSYNDNISEILQMYPTNNTMIINDTARNILGLDGLKTR
ncbi:hypothetical protein IKN40_07995 [bacterium]|nr:hypothetical protein [bacterium]